jgi:hypothetical protein
VPQGDVRFPSETWGMKLGRNVDSIRIKGVYSEHRVKLEKLENDLVHEKKTFFFFVQ